MTTTRTQLADALSSARPSMYVSSRLVDDLLAAGVRPPARVVSTREELNACNDDAVLHWLDDAGLPHIAFAFRLRENSNVWPTTVIHEGGAL